MIDTRIITDYIKNVLYITINNTENSNLLTRQMFDKITESIRTIDKNTYCIIIKHTGPDFSNGGYLGDCRVMGKSEIELFATSLINCLKSIYESCVPVIACVYGHAYGGGLSLLEACDIVIADKNAMFAIPEMKNNFPPVISFSAASRILPQKKLMQLAYTGNSIDAEEALQYGIISEITDGNMNDNISNYINLFSTCNPAAISIIHKLRIHMDTGHYYKQIEAASSLLVDALKCPEIYEVLNAKDEKRNANFKK